MPSSLSLPSAPPPSLPHLSPGVKFGGICGFVCVVPGGGPGAVWAVPGRQRFRSRDGPWKLIEVTEECEVGPASALIQERFENYFMPVSSAHFDNVEGRS